jgi:hypothetical protein
LLVRRRRAWAGCGADVFIVRIKLQIIDNDFQKSLVRVTSDPATIGGTQVTALAIWEQTPSGSSSNSMPCPVHTLNYR